LCEGEYFAGGMADSLPTAPAGRLDPGAATGYLGLREAMEVTDALVAEHDAMRRLLDLLTRTVGRLREGRQVPAPAIRRLLDLNRQFGEVCHHAKEEHALFPVLEANGISREGGPLQVLVEEHRLGRSLMAELDQMLEQYIYADGGISNLLADRLEDYVGLVREHMWKEEYLFRVAAENLNERAQREAAEAIARVEESLAACQARGDFVRELERLESTFLAVPAG